MSDPTSDSNAAVEGRHRVERVLGEGAADPPRYAAAQICRLINGRAEQAPEVEGVA